MGKAAYDQAKKNGELITQRLRAAECAGSVYPLMCEAAHLIEWLQNERDSMIDEIEQLRSKINAAVNVGHNDDCMFCGFKDRALTSDAVLKADQIDAARSLATVEGNDCE